MNNQNFKGAIKILDYFQQSGEDFRRIAQLFGGEHYASMMSVIRGRNWTKKDINRWKKAIDDFQSVKENVRKERTSDNTVIVLKQVKKTFKIKKDATTKSSKIRKNRKKKKSARVSRGVRKNAERD